MADIKQNGFSTHSTQRSDLAGTDVTTEEEPTLTHTMMSRLRSLRRNVRATRNRLGKYMWPGSFLSLGGAVGGTAVVRFYDTEWLQPLASKLETLEASLPLLKDLPLNPAAICVCTFVGLTVFVVSTMIRRILLRQLLTYRGWLYQRGGRAQSVFIVVWGMAIKLLSGWSPTLYCYQSCLPRMPVPPLRQSIQNLIDSLEPIYAHDPDKLNQMKKEAKDFEDTIGPKLQRALVMRSWWADNFVSDWWRKYVYLMGRSPLPINSNYYVMDQGYWTPTTRQSARAAGVLYQMMKVREMILAEDLKPLMIRGIIPVCMDQYRYIFSTTRVAGEEIDTLVNYPEHKSQHVVVNRKGILYKLDVMDKYGRIVSPTALETQFEHIMQDAEHRLDSVSRDSCLIPVLTSQDRTSWARARQEYLATGVNKETLELIESAILYVVLDTNSFSEISGRAAHLLHGKADLFWFDKSVQMIVMADAHMGLNCEHSLADAPAVAHVLEYNHTLDVISKLYEDDGHCIDVGGYKTPAFDLQSKPVPLLWEVSDGLAGCIAKAESNAQKSIDDLDLIVYDHREFGKGAMKKCRVSPDAFIQMALHATYRKMYGVPALTYEASMTRLFKCGRTETVRSMTKEADAFVHSFLDKNASLQEQSSMLREACNRHAVLYKDAMNGQCFDRHLFALYVASKGLGVDCDFLKKVLSIPWTLSTSQQPQQQIPNFPSCNDPKFSEMICPGGGFGPVSDDGYGVSYMVPGDNRVFFHITSRKSKSNTNSTTFATTLIETLREMKDLFR